MAELHVVTGAFGYSGRYIADRLLAQGRRVRTLTNSPVRANPFGGRIEIRPMRFDDVDALADSLEGAAVLYNTYWVRFNHGDFCHAQAVENTRSLFMAAARAGVQRVVHVSITNPSEDSPLEYFRGKAQLERVLIESGLSYAILRPAVLFGGEDILINNIAWGLRRFAVVPVFGDGMYRLQPIHVSDLARLAVEHGRHRQNVIVDAVGPETYSYRELVKTLGPLIGSPRPVVGVSPMLGYLAGKLVGWWQGDVVITREEIAGLMADLLVTNSRPSGQIRLSDWAAEHKNDLGRHYASELARRRNRTAAYGQLSRSAAQSPVIPVA